MSTFCTSCGTASTGATFCTSCGAAMGTTAPTTTSTEEVSQIFADVADQTPIDTEGEVTKEDSNASSKKKPLLIGATAVLFLGVGIGAFFAGKSSVDLERERKISYDKGYSSGDLDGFDRGDSAGYSRGYGAGRVYGCEWVFDQANYASYVTKYDVYGYAMGRFPGSVYVSKTNC